MSKDFYEELNESVDDFRPPTQQPDDDFYSELTKKVQDFGTPTNQPALNIAKGQTKGKSFLTGAGYGLTKAGRALEEAYLKFFGTPTEREDLQKLIDKENEVYGQITSEWNPNAGWFKGGEFTGQIIPGLALPTPQSKSMAARAAINALIGAGYEGATTTGGAGDRLVAAGLGGVGGAAGSGAADLLQKGWNRLRGVYDQPEAVALAERLRAAGLRPRLGDIMDPGTGTLVRSGENLLAETPIGSKAAAEDVEKLRRMIVPDRVSGTNVIAESVQATERGVQKRADEIWQPFREFVSQNQVPGVRPVNLQRGLREIIKYDKNFLNDIQDDVLRGKLESLISAKPNQLRAVPAEDYVEINSALSGLAPYIKARAQPTPGSPVLADKQAYKRFAGNIMEGLRKDWDTWKTYKSPNAQQARQLLENSQVQWKQEILPWQRSDLAHKLKQIEQHGAPETARLISGEPDIDITSLVRDYMKKYGPYDSEVPVEALMQMKRQGQTLASATEPVSGLDLTRGVFGAPAAMLSRRPGFQKYALSSAQPTGPLGELMRRGIIGTGRESGLESLVGVGILNSLLQGGDKERSIGATTEESFRHPGAAGGR